MRTLLLFSSSILIVAGCSSQGTSSSKTITATTESDGRLNPVSLQLAKPARVTCRSAVGNNGSPAKCNVNGATLAPPSESVIATDKIYFMCEGTAPVKCTAELAE
jgi:hypothetical protein